MTRYRIGAAVIALTLAAGAAQAHSPYLLPNFFDATGRDHVTVQASFTEKFFTPEVVMKSDDFHAIGPDGARIAVTPSYFKDLTVIEVPTAAPAGTWRITSGVRAGRMSKVVLKGGQWEFLEPGKPLPAGAQDMQSITTAETYVSRGALNDTALKPVGNGLEFQALTHPNKIGEGEEARFVVLVDGKPLPGQKITVNAAGADEHAGKPVEVTSDAEGRFTLKLDHAGAYHAMTRYRIAPAGDQPGRSLTYALTFEVLP